MGLFNFFRRDQRQREDYSVSVKIYEPVINRIKASLLASSIEEGGKFLGAIIERGNHVAVSVYSYIDAGPRVNNSQTHIVPDGEHQEYLFRILEGYDSGIEHIGSWHSHHCNGYPNLSDGDISGYHHNVNNRDYNLNWFFVMLITSVKRDGMEANYYLFHRGDSSIYTVDLDEISVVKQEYQYENILREVERSTYNHRLQSGQVITTSPSADRTKAWDEFLMSIRSEDKVWIERTFDSPHAFRDKRDDSIYWKLNVPVYQRTLEVTYAYPKHSEIMPIAFITISCQEKEVLRSEINLDEHRFEHIINQINIAKEILQLHPGEIK